MFLFVLAASGPGPAAAYDAALTPRQSVERHIKGMQTANMDMAVETYAEDAIVMTPPGAFPPGTKSLAPGIAIGKSEIRKFFTSLVSQDHGAAAKGMVWQLDTAPQGGIIMHWTQLKGTPQQVDGIDVFMVRDGKILFQSIGLNAPKK